LVTLWAIAQPGVGQTQNEAFIGGPVVVIVIAIA
jgi:hypothetical protein